MNNFSEKAAAAILKLIHRAADVKEFNGFLNTALDKLKMSKTDIAKAVFNLLKSGKDLPETSEEALKILTYMPIPLLRKEEVFNKLLAIMTPEDKKKIPTPTTVWGDQKYVRAGKKGDWESEGYRIDHFFGSWEEDEGAEWKTLEVRAYREKEDEVGSATFLIHPDGGLIAHSVEVEPQHQRKGLASAMYRYAEKLMNTKIEPTGNQTEDGKKFWDQSGRSFGEKHNVTAGVLDFPRKRLPDSVFTYEEDLPLPKLRRDLRSLILAEARSKLAVFGAELIGANLYGGASGYQYNEGADIDVALYIDWDDYKGKHEILESAFKTIEIPWGGFVIHLFVKPPHQREQIEVADAVYDILHDEWKIPPLVLPKGFDPNVFFQPIIELAEIKAQEVDVQMGIVSREWAKLKKALQAKAGEPQDPEVVERRIEKQKQIVQDEVNELCRIFGDVWDGRLKLHDDLRKKYVENRDVDRYERLQYPEIVWKYLDQAGYVEFLKVLIKANKNGVIEKLLSEI